MVRRRHRKYAWGLLAAVLVAGIAGPFLVQECDVCMAASSLFLSGTVEGRCTINVVADAQAGNLDITAPGAQRVMIGSVQQDCNGRRTYMLTVSSRNCAVVPTGGKLMNENSNEILPYSIEFNNPTTGWSQPVVTGLLESACTYQIGRFVLLGRVRDETSTLFVNFTGIPDLAAGAYQDVVTVSINIM